MKLKTAAGIATLLSACCFALPAQAKAPKAKPKKNSTAGSVNTSAVFMSTATYTNAWALAAPISGNINGDHVIANADLQSLLAYLHSGLGSTSPVPSSDNAEIQRLITDIKPGSISQVPSTNTNSSSDGLFMNLGTNSGTLPVAGLTVQPNFIPEPASAILAGCGLVVLLAARRRLQAG